MRCDGASESVFPYKFVNESTLNFNGETPDISYFKNITNSEYENIYLKNNWSLREESIKYIKNDILGLLEVIDKFRQNLFISHNIDLTEGLTISRLALNKFLRFYLNNSKIPLINKINIFNFLYLGYYGGRTEVFKPYGKNLYYYDVNSLYPKAALNNMPGIDVKYIKSLTNNSLNLDSLFGIFRAKVKTNHNYLGLLPPSLPSLPQSDGSDGSDKTNLGLIFPIGEYEGVWSSVELKYAQDNGYKVNVIEGYGFNEVPSYFKDYVHTLYDLKSKSKGFESK